MTPINVLERVALTAPLGLRFQDAITGEMVGSGLSVLAYPATNPSRQFELVASRSGIYALHHAPGLREFERRDADAVWEPPLPLKSFVIEVTDLEGRFLPFQFTVQLPARGLYVWVSPLDGSPVRDAPGIPLYSTAARRTPAGMAVVRAELLDIVQGKPASWAVLEAGFNGRLLGRGIADEAGRVLLSFPYPAPRAVPFASPPGSPPAGAGKPLFSQEWVLQLQARCSPPLASPLQEANSGLADLRAVLSQLPAKLWEDAARTTPVTEATLQFGHELILRSREGGLSPPAPPSTLFITRA